MADEINNPQYTKSINDFESQDETVEEKSNYDNNSNQNVQTLINKSEQFDITINKTEQNEINKNNNINNEEQQEEHQKRRKCSSPKVLKVVSIMYIIIFFIDIGLQIGFLYFSLLIFLDGVIIIGNAILYLYVIYKKKPLGDWLGAITIIVWIAEYPLRGIGATNLPSDIMTYIEGALLVIRTIINFLCIPYSCGC